MPKQDWCCAGGYIKSKREAQIKRISGVFPCCSGKIDFLFDEASSTKQKASPVMR